MFFLRVKVQYGVKSHIIKKVAVYLVVWVKWVFKYIQMIASGIVELSQGNNDWTTENAYEYLLSLAPFSIKKFAKETELLRKSLK